VPFADEPSQVTILDYQPRWPAEFDRLAVQLGEALGELAVAIDHVGSTSVPGLAAKDCIDIQVRVLRVDEASVVPPLAAISFRCRPERWNRSEVSSGFTCRKLVFAPPAGTRICNVHVRENASPSTRYALLFRDYLRSNNAARQAWGGFKKRLAASVPDLLEYGQVKGPATGVLMQAAELWAAHTGWTPTNRPSPLTY
jgi:GrpB-like predicted nucleotidyltransferase (UPF0157 family)